MLKIHLFVKQPTYCYTLKVAKRNVKKKEGPKPLLKKNIVVIPNVRRA